MDYLFIIVIFLSVACTMMVDEQIQSNKISYELTKSNHSNLILLVPGG